MVYPTDPKWIAWEHCYLPWKCIINEYEYHNTDEKNWICLLNPPESNKRKRCILSHRNAFNRLRELQILTSHNFTTDFEFYVFHQFRSILIILRLNNNTHLVHVHVQIKTVFDLIVHMYNRSERNCTDSEKQFSNTFAAHIQVMELLFEL